MIILDTNVISEIFKPHPEARVVTWLEGLTGQVAITAITMAELLAGVGRLPDGQRKRTLTGSIEAAVAPYRESGAILAFDHEAAAQYGVIVAARERAGLPISMADAQIAAICRAHGAICATRNTRDFDKTGIDLVDPWELPD